MAILTPRIRGLARGWSSEVLVDAYGTVVDTDTTAARTANDAAITAALAEAKATGLPLRFKHYGTLYVSSQWDLDAAGLIVRGNGPTHCEIIQTDPTKRVFTVTADATWNGGRGDFVHIESLKLEGPGAGDGSGSGGTSTAAGIYLDESAGDGDFFRLHHVHIEGFDIGVDNHGISQAYASNYAILRNRINWRNASGRDNNTVRLFQGNITAAEEVGVELNSGAGVSIDGGDMGNQPMSVLVNTAARLSMRDLNIESAGSGTVAFVDIQNSGHVVAENVRFLKGAGADIPAFRMAASSLTIINPFMDGFTNNVLVEQQHASLGPVILGEQTFTSSGASGPKVSHTNGFTYAPSIFPVRQDNSPASASSANRNHAWAVLSRDAANAQDKLYWYGQDKRSGTAAFNRYFLNGVLEGTGSPEGAVTAGPGTMYLNQSGGASTTLYVKESGTGNTGWVAK